MPYYGVAAQQQSGISLQSILASASSGDVVYQPHHPITCTGRLCLNEDNSMECDHAKVDGDDKRTQQVMNHSVAILIIEEAVRKFGG